MLHFKVGIPFTQTMIWFGVLSYFCLRQELAHGKVHAANRRLVAGGHGAILYTCFTHMPGACIGGWGGSCIPFLPGFW